MRFYKLLLGLYPASFRAEYGAELCRHYTARRRHVSRLLPRSALWLGDVLDVLRNAPAAHLDVLCQDLRYAARTLGRAPAFALTAVAVTALGIGANTAVFSVTDRVLLRPLPYADADRLVKVWQTPPDFSRLEPSPANFRDWRHRATVFAGLAAYTDSSANLVGEGEPLHLGEAVVTSDLLPLLGVRPALGRLFSAEEDREGAPGTVLVSHGLWQQVFGGSRSVLGRTVRLDDETFTVIGVLPPGFSFPSRETQLWTPLRLGAESYVDRSDNYLDVVGKLKAGVTLAEARAEMDLIGRQLEREHPKENGQIGVGVIPLSEEVPAQTRLLLTALFGAAFCVLLIACTNLANLLLARALARRNELTVRAALGAGRERLVRQLLTESLVLASLGGLLGVVLAVPAVRLLAVLVPASLPIGPPTALDPRVLTFTAVLTALTGIGFGVLPALRVRRGTGFAALQEGARGGVGGGKRLRAALVAAEIAASVVLLVATGLLVQALARVQATEPGFRTAGVMTLRTPLPLPKYETTARRAAFYSQVLSEVRALPGVTDAAYISFLPMVMGGGIWSVEIPGEASGPRGVQPTASLRYVTPGFFGALGIPLRRGRDVSDADTAASPFVAVVSESFVRRHWPGKDPLGRRFQFALAERVVVGVVGDIRVRGLEQDSEPQVYLPNRQVPDGSIVGYVPRELVYRASSDPGLLVAAVRRILARADPELPVSEVRSLASIVESQTTPRRTQLLVVGSFAALSLLLAGVGIHGLLSFAVSQRTPEIGMRMALGAQSGDLLGMVMREGLALAALGGLAGAGVAYSAGQAMEALLAGVRPGDAATFLAAVTLVFLMTVSGSLAPALRAVRMDPTAALYGE